MHYDFTDLWGGGQGKHVLDRNLKKSKNKKIKMLTTQVTLA